MSCSSRELEVRCDEDEDAGQGRVEEEERGGGRVAAVLERDGWE